MKQGVLAAIGFAALTAAGGYWLGRAERPVEPVAAAPAQGERQPLYYRNPMGLPDTSPVPKKDSMGMDYIPVYAETANDDATDAGSIRISPEKIQKLGVRTEAATLASLDRVIRAAGRIEPDERRSYAVAPKFEGYVERLHVNVTGQPVRRGQALFEVYSPELVSAQREYAIAEQGVDRLQEAAAPARDGMRQLAEASLARLRNWDIPEAQLQALAQSGEARRTLTFRSPVNGIVTEKKAVQGMRFMPGETLYQITDLAAVWAVADVFERDIAALKPGARARIRIDAYPERSFEGRVSYIYPTLNPETRTLPVRVDLPNAQGLLKPGMFARLELPVADGGAVVSVPQSAVIDSGVRQIVLVQVGEGRFAPREVRLGARSDERVTVLDGLRAGETVVVAANFLIDAESNLKAAVAGFARAGSAGTPPVAQVGHRASGKIESIDAAAGTASISHGPVASLHWPAMTMEFTAANPAILQRLQPGAAVDFEFVERARGEWVVTAVQPAAQPGPPASR